MMVAGHRPRPSLPFARLAGCRARLGGATRRGARRCIAPPRSSSAFAMVARAGARMLDRLARLRPTTILRAASSGIDHVGVTGRRTGTGLAIARDDAETPLGIGMEIAPKA